MNTTDFDKLQIRDKLEIVTNESKHGIPVGSTVVVHSVVKAKGLGTVVQVLSEALNKVRFVRPFDVDHLKDCDCPRCNSGLGIDTGRKVHFVSKHAHYARKRPYTRKTYGKIAGTGRIMAVLNQAHVPMTAHEIAHVSKVEVKTVRNILGVMMREAVVLKYKDKLGCYVSKRMSTAYRLPKMYDDFTQDQRVYNFNCFGNRVAAIRGYGKKVDLSDCGIMSPVGK